MSIFIYVNVNKQDSYKLWEDRDRQNNVIAMVEGEDLI